MDCIKGEKKEVHIIEKDRCTKCGNCFQVCPTLAVKVGGGLHAY